VVDEEGGGGRAPGGVEREGVVVAGGVGVEERWGPRAAGWPPPAASNR
jgi:hypothetical protein